MRAESLRFVKAHGLGNDFLLVDSLHAPPEVGSWARRLCDRHLGVGADGILVYRLADDAVEMRLINPDGGEVELSGNGVRCLAAHVVRNGWLGPRHTVRTRAGPRPVVVESLGRSRFRVETDLGPPRLASRDIPMALDPALERVLEHALGVGSETVLVTAVSMGNPHCTVFTPAPADDAVVARLGPALERHPAFPERTNVEFVSALTRTELRARFWERGVGPTRASGTGAAAACVAAALTGRAERRARVLCDGGVLEVEWLEQGPVRQFGEVELLFEGEWLGPATARS